MKFSVFIFELHTVREHSVAASAAIGTVDVDVGQELNVQIDFSRAVAGRTTQFAGVVGKIARFKSLIFGVLRFGKNLAQLIVYVGIGGDGRAYIDADRRGVNEFDGGNARSLNAFDVLRKRSFADKRRKCRNKTFEHQRGFAGTGNAGDHGKPPFGNPYVQGLDRVNRFGLEVNGPK